MLDYQLSFIGRGRTYEFKFRANMRRRPTREDTLGAPSVLRIH